LQLTALVSCLLCPYCKEKIYPNFTSGDLSLLVALTAAFDGMFNRTLGWISRSWSFRWHFVNSSAQDAGKHY
jgi:hypothetical protein